MIKTRLIEILDKILKKIQRKLITYWFQLPQAILLFLFGFLIASGIGTLFAQTPQWQVFDAIFLVIVFEVINPLIYTKSNKFFIFSKETNYIKNINYLKIGILFGFFVDAFKLGS